MFFFHNTVSRERATAPARYLIAQYMPNVFRRERINVGVVVEKSGFVSARFRGETDDGGWDLRNLRGMNANAYRLWVDHWRKTTANSQTWPEQSLDTRKDQSFVLVDGGELFDTGTDTPYEICKYLYSLLVSSGGLAEALDPEATDDVQVALRDDVRDAFKASGILGSNLLTRHPVLADQDVKGTKTWHRIAFFQELGHEAWAMEPVDFQPKQKNVARDHAAYARYVFDDFRARSLENGMKINPIAIVKMEPTDLSHPAVGKGLEILGQSCTIVNWHDAKERNRFIEERSSIANAA